MAMGEVSEKRPSEEVGRVGGGALHIRIRWHRVRLSRFRSEQE
jgi:hypothetical protein